MQFTTKFKASDVREGKKPQRKRDKFDRMVSLWCSLKGEKKSK